MLKKHKKNGLIIVFALLLRIPLLNGSFWMDEAAQALEVVRPITSQFDIVADFQPPLLHLFLHLAQYFSHAEWWLRTIGALIPGLVTIFFSYKLAEKLFNKNVAVISSLFLTTSSFHIFYSQELRPYSLPAMFGLISMYYFFELLKKGGAGGKTGRKNRLGQKNKIGLSVANLLGLYSSYLFPFLIISQVIFAILKDDDCLFNKISWLGLKSRFKLGSKFKLTKRFLRAQVLPIIGFLPWLPMFFKQLEAGGMVRKNLPGWENVVSIPQIKAIPLVFAKFIFGNLDIEPNIFFIIPGLLVVGSFSILLYKKLQENEDGFFKKLFNAKENNNLTFTLSWLILPLLTSWLISFFVPVVRPKRLLFLLPAFYILAGFLVDSFSNKKEKMMHWLGTLLLLSLLSINTFSIVAYYSNPKLQRENWKGLYQDITKDFSPGRTVLIYSFPDEFAPMAWYDNSDYPTVSTGKLFINNVDDLSNTLKMVVDYDNVLVFDYLRDLSDPERKIEQELIKFGFKEIGALDYPNIGFVRIFSKPHSLIGVK